MKISKNDFELAWNEEKTIFLTKTRIVIHNDLNDMWEIDFFKDKDETYFVLAEFELSSNKHKAVMPDIIKNNLLYVVPDNDPRFKNRALADSDKVRLLYQDIAETISDKTIQPDASISL
jgi:CYTH domain-containing protein